MRQIVLVCTFCYYNLVTNKQKAGTSPTKVWFPALYTKTGKLTLTYPAYFTMITLFVEENYPLTPDFYNKKINSLQFHQLTCTCGHSGCLSVHSYYYRHIKASSGRLRFRICRVICKCCGHTHAVLLSSMVPHSQIYLAEHIFLNSLPDLTASWFSLFSCQFMQIKRLPNVLFLNTT